MKVVDGKKQHSSNRILCGRKMKVPEVTPQFRLRAEGVLGAFPLCDHRCLLWSEFQEKWTLKQSPRHKCEDVGLGLEAEVR